LAIKQNLAFVIESDAGLFGTCENVLKSVGFEVETFMDGKLAYERLAVEPAPRLVLIDLELPNVSGHEITWEMWFKMEDTRIIIIASDKKAAAIYKNKEGVDQVLIKPFSPNELTEVVRPYAYLGSMG